MKDSASDDRSRPLARRATGAMVALLILVAVPAHGVSSGDVQEQTQTWWSVNSTMRLTDRWGLLGDFHIRRGDFVNQGSFYFLRFGANYWFSDALTAAVGYAHMWKAPAHEDWSTWSNEDRAYEQVQHVARFGPVALTNRLRNEQRWQQKVTNDEITDDSSFSNRLRYFLGVTVPVSRNPAFPSLVLSGEAFVQFGPGVENNTFDQARLFAGIRRGLGHDWSFDMGYMPVLQQKAGGGQYDLNHTIRLFFYFTPDFREQGAGPDPVGNDE